MPAEVLTDCSCALQVLGRSQYPLKIDFAHPALTTAPGECCSAWELRSPVDRSMRELQPPNEGVALLVAGSSTKDSSTLTLRLYVVSRLSLAAHAPRTYVYWMRGPVYMRIGPQPRYMRKTSHVPSAPRTVRCSVSGCDLSCEKSSSELVS